MNAIAQHITGIQHIGIPTNDLAGTIAFYEALGFTVVHRAETATNHVAFLRLNNLVIETYQSTGAPQAKGFDGAIDHIAVDVDDIEAVWDAVRASGLTPMEDEIQFLPFWEKGFRYFKVLGPNHEPVEFGQIL